jgi:hypothetical protein
MAFTHDRPTANRHYVTAYSTTTGNRLAIYASSKVSSFRSINTYNNKSITRDNTSVNSFSGGSQYQYGSDSRFTTQTNAGSNFSNSARTIDNRVYDADQESTVYGSTNNADRGNGFTNLGGTNATDGGAGGNTALQGTTGEVKYDNSFVSKAYYFNGSNSASYRIVYNEVETIEGGYTTLTKTSTRRNGGANYASSEGLSSTARTGSILAYTYTSTSWNGSSYSDNDGNSGSNSYSTSGSTTGSFSHINTGVVKTLLSSKTGNIYTADTDTVSTSQSYSQLSSDLLQTFSSYFTFQTLTFSDFTSTVRTSSDYVTESESLSTFYNNDYKIYTIYGGAAYVEGGVTLPNLGVTGASTVSTYGFIPSQQTIVNTYSTRFRTAEPATYTSTRTFPSNASSGATRTTRIDREGTRLTTSSLALNDPADFGRSTSSAKVFTTQTFNNGFTDTTVTNGSVSTATTRSYANQTTVSASGKNTILSQFESSYIGSDGYSTFYYPSVSQVMTTYPSRVALNISNTISSIETINLTTGRIADNFTSTQSGFGRENYRLSVLTRDKGKQGGIQYESSTNISGAVRSTYPISIADEVITTSTRTSPAATINLTVNSAESNSYTFSAGLPLGLELKLNRYMTFLPIDGYGSIFSTVGNSTDKSSFLLKYEGDGSSVVRFTSTGKYSTSQTGGSDQTRTDRTTQSFASVLNGLAKIQQGQQYPNGQETVAKMTDIGAGFNYYPAAGGQVFTDTEGTIIYRSMNPASFFMFGGSNSSSFSLNNPGANNDFKTQTIPANSVLFAQLSTFVKAGAGILTVDRKQ